MYNSPIKSLLDLEIPSTARNEQVERYERLKEWNAHLEDIRTYELKLASYFKNIKEMVVEASQSPNQQGSSKSSSPTLRFRKLTGSKAKSPKGGASHSAQSSGGASNSMFSDDE
ncbi:hypothetical protein BASA60_000967 [Batrachochytrium salamandrivorans]|nr:hypothetical protein BASA60_000967 [Batrachochytrium salamandrivorans]